VRTDSPIAIVTGAGSGLGRQIALALNEDGWRVALTGRRVEALEETASLCALPDAVSALPGDVSDPASVARLFADVERRHGRLDLLVNNAGAFAPAVPFEELSFDAWRAVIDVNLHGAFLCASAAFRQMKAQSPRGGRIINNGSISAHAPRPNSAPYTASKHAMTGLTKSLSLDGRKYDIACGQIDIGNAATEATSQIGRGVPQADGSILAEATMDCDHAAREVLHMANLPLSANILFVTIMATAMPFVGRG
jgi:NAD(P)-dependent dehydrogenase (short-subunit alcohol dehydrogenase family)